MRIREYDNFVFVNGSYKSLKDNRTYKEHCCKNCEEYYLARHKGSKFCCKKCATEYNWKKKDSVYNSKEYRDKLSKGNSGKVFSEERKENISKSKYIGGPTYDTYAPQLEWCEKVRRNKEDKRIIEVKCFKCEEWFIPKRYEVRHRIESITNKRGGENHFYCSEHCKNSCSIYGKNIDTIIKEDVVRAGNLSWLELTREVQPELRKLVLERDGYECIKCGSKDNLQCHHIYPVSINPIESADMDNCITLCMECHRKVHQKDGCRYNQLKMDIC